MAHGFLLRCNAAEGRHGAIVGADGARADAHECTVLTAGPVDAARILDRYLEDHRVDSPDVPAAIAVWDGRTRELRLVRDRTGLYPLFYSHAAQELISSPDARAILAEPDVSRELDPLALAGWLAGVDGDPAETLYRRLRRVPAGHVLEADRHGERERRVWEPPASGSFDPSEASRFGEVLEAAIGRSLDGRAAIFLSGGIDSAAVAAATTVASGGVGVQSPLALCVHIEGASEEQTQRAVADALDLERRTREATSGTGLIERALDRAAVSLWPTGSAWQPVFDDLVAEAQESGVTAILDGIGGDDLLDAGLSSAWPALRSGRLDVLLRLAAAERGYTGGGMLSVLKAAVPRRRAWSAPHFIARHHHAALAERANLTHDDLLSTRLVAGWEETWDTGLRLGLASRHPLWDASVVGIVRGLPRESLIANGEAKSPARSYLRARIPLQTGRWPRPEVADSLLEALEREHDIYAPPAESFRNLIKLGVIDADVRQEGLALSLVTTILACERWTHVS